MLELTLEWGHSVHFGTREMGCQADDQDNGSPVKMPTITPFSNLRNGSNLKMQWRRWTGGKTRGISKSSNEDPAVSSVLCVGAITHACVNVSIMFLSIPCFPLCCVSSERIVPACLFDAAGSWSDRVSAAGSGRISTAFSAQSHDCAESREDSWGQSRHSF